MSLEVNRLNIRHRQWITDGIRSNHMAREHDSRKEVGANRECLDAREFHNARRFDTQDHLTY